MTNGAAEGGQPTSGALRRRQPVFGRATHRRITRLTTTLADQWADHAEAREYLHYQWSERVLSAYAAGRRAQRTYSFSRWLVVVGATVVPTLVAGGARSHGTVANVTLIAAVVLSLLVAIASSAVQVQAGQRWRAFSQYEAELEHAGWQLYQKRGEYTDWDIEQRFAAFVDRVERIVIAYQTGTKAPLNRGEGSEATPDPLIPDWQWP